jgi:hypothetical protein
MVDVPFAAPYCASSGLDTLNEGYTSAVNQPGCWRGCNAACA